MEVLEKLCYNCVVGGDAKYRCVKVGIELDRRTLGRQDSKLTHLHHARQLSNARINDAMNEPALAAMKMIGWKEVDGCLELPTNVQVSMDTVRAIQAAITTIKREQSRVPSRT